MIKMRFLNFFRFISLFRGFFHFQLCNFLSVSLAQKVKTQTAGGLVCEKFTSLRVPSTFRDNSPRAGGS